MISLVLSPGRYDRPLAKLAASVERLQDLAGVIVHTEQGGKLQPREALFRSAGWPFYHPAGAGPGETLCQWDPNHRLAGEPLARRLSPLWYFRVGGARTPPFYATVTPLQPPRGRVVVVIAAHLPTRNTARRRTVWASCMAGLARLVGDVRARYPGCRVMVAADFNVDHRTDRALVGRYLTPLQLADAWRGREPAIAGTHGRRLIDAVWTDLPVVSCKLVADDDSSDHRPHRVQVRTD